MPVFAGKSIAKRMAASRMQYVLPLAVGMGAAINSADPMQGSINFAQEAAFGSDQVDNTVLGTDLTPGMFMPISPTQRVGGTTIAGAGVGALMGKGRGALVGAAAGAALGMAGQYRAMRPFLNPTIMGEAFGKKRDIAAEMNKEDAERGYRKLPHSGNTLPYIPDTVISGSHSYDVYDPGIPVARRRRVRPQATGDMVFGMYNLRM